jgi:hypothetical protein
MLAWFVFFVGFGVAAPVFGPSTLEAICSSSSGSTLVEKVDAPAKNIAGHLLECPLCASIGAPPPQLLVFNSSAPAPFVAEALSPAPRAWLMAGPSPGRGPPASS